jgi:DNA-binding MarR family transcriptional regulator
VVQGCGQAGRQVRGQVELEALPSLLRRATSALDSLLVQCLEAQGLTGVSATGLHVLSLLNRAKPLTLLAERLCVTPQGMGRTVRRLEELELVERYEDPYDARAPMVELTDEGAVVAATVRKAVEQALDGLADEVEPGRLQDLVRDLAVLAEVGAEPHPWDRW